VLNMRSVFLVLRAYHFLTDNSLQSGIMSDGILSRSRTRAQGQAYPGALI